MSAFRPGDRVVKVVESGGVCKVGTLATVIDMAVFQRLDRVHTLPDQMPVRLDTKLAHPCGDGSAYTDWMTRPEYWRRLDDRNTTAWDTCAWQPNAIAADTGWSPAKAGAQ